MGCFPAFLIALLLQVIFFSFGGFAVLGVNLCVMATPAVIAHYLFRSRLQPHIALKNRLFVGIGAGVIGVGGAGALAFCADARWWKKLSESCLALAGLSYSGIYFG